LAAKRQTLDSTKKELELRIQGLTEKENKYEKDLEVLRKENRQLKKTVYAYQLWTKTPGGLSNQQPVAATYHRCRYCTKVFNSEYYLEGHLSRRHPDQPNYVAERLNIPSPTMMMPQQMNVSTDLLDKVTTTIERFSTKVLETERQLRAEMEKKLSEEVAKREHALEDAYRTERLRYEDELRDLKVRIERY
jgi:hypothetical protein